MVRGEHARFQEVRVSATSCVGIWLFREAEFQGPVCVAQPGEITAADTVPRGLAGVVLREQIDFTNARFHAEADFSHLVIEHEAKFQGAIFAGPADFRRLQCSSNLVLSGCLFQGPVSFDGAIINGLLEAIECTFHVPPTFRQATLARGLRLSQVCWSASSSLQHSDSPPKTPNLDLTDCFVDGPLDLADPLDDQGRPLRAFWVELTGASATHVGLTPQHMRSSFLKSAADVRKRNLPNRRHQLAALARLFEASLIDEVRFSEADYFYRQANNYGDRPVSSCLMSFLWGHGTLPWRAFLFLLLISMTLAGFTIWAAQVQGRDASQVILKAFGRSVLGESPPVQTLQQLPLWWGLVDGTILLMILFQAVLLNLFFVALARKMLR